MTHPPQHPPPEGEPWKPPQEPPADPYAGQPPPYPGAYGGRQPPAAGGGLPGYPGEAGGYVDPTLGLASRWARLGAALIDGILIGLVSFVLTFPFVDYGEMFDPENTSLFPAAQWASTFTSATLGFFYYWFMHYKWGQTLGKQLLGIQVVRQNDYGPISAGSAAGRAAFYSVLGGIVACVGIIDILWLLWDERKQCLHDKVAGTVVRKVDPSTPNPYAGR